MREEGQTLGRDIKREGFLIETNGLSVEMDELMIEMDSWWRQTNDRDGLS